MSDLRVSWIDRGREPKVAPNPRYPNGVDADLSNGAPATCSATLPYPAKRVGLFVIECGICGLRTVITTAGRPDDPRSVKVACRYR